jgi:hypothetical protein
MELCLNTSSLYPDYRMLTYIHVHPYIDTCMQCVHTPHTRISLLFMTESSSGNKSSFVHKFRVLAL